MIVICTLPGLLESVIFCYEMFSAMGYSTSSVLSCRVLLFSVVLLLLPSQLVTCRIVQFYSINLEMYNSSNKGKIGVFFHIKKSLPKCRTVDMKMGYCSCRFCANFDPVI
jgi:hypothetical protein